MKTECLFLGGSLDGTRREMKDSEYDLCKPVRRADAPPRLNTRLCDDLGSFTMERYVRRTIYGKSRRFDVFAIDSLEYDELIEMLLNGYRPEEKP
jgi:hypothetical protein